MKDKITIIVIACMLGGMVGVSFGHTLTNWNNDPNPVVSGIQEGDLVCITGIAALDNNPNDMRDLLFCGYLTFGEAADDTSTDPL